MSSQRWRLRPSLASTAYCLLASAFVPLLGVDGHALSSPRRQPWLFSVSAAPPNIWRTRPIGVGGHVASWRRSPCLCSAPAPLLLCISARASSLHLQPRLSLVSVPLLASAVHWLLASASVPLFGVGGHAPSSPRRRPFLFLASAAAPINGIRAHHLVAAVYCFLASAAVPLLRDDARAHHWAHSHVVCPRPWPCLCSRLEAPPILICAGVRAFVGVNGRAHHWCPCPLSFESAAVLFGMSGRAYHHLRRGPCVFSVSSPGVRALLGVGGRAHHWRPHP